MPSNLIAYYFSIKGNVNEISKSFVTTIKKYYLYLNIELTKINLRNILKEKYIS